LNPDVANAIPELVRRGLLTPDQAPLLLRVARGELVSVYHEIRLLLWGGVFLASAGAGLLVKENFEHIGPVAVAVALGIAAGAALAWVARKAPPFSWEQTAPPHVVFDYVLLLGVLLAAADLAFIEARFTPLGRDWPWHLLIVAILMAVLALRYDSRTVFSLAMSTFAAWRGVSVTLIENSLWRGLEDSVRLNALACGVLFILLGRYLWRSGRKPHFEPVAVHLGWLLFFGSVAWGLGNGPGKEFFSIAILLGGGAGLAWYAYRQNRFSLLAFGVFAGYIGSSRLLLHLTREPILVWLWFLVSAVGVIAGLRKLQLRMKEIE
jgi:Predicted membrane protein (DUF2157)